MPVSERAASILAAGKTLVDYGEGDLFDLINDVAVRRILDRHVEQFESAVDLGREDPHGISQRLEDFLGLGEEIRGFSMTKLTRTGRSR